jgi:hypothetical protein
MSSISKINIYTCDTCKRSIERLADGRRPDPVYCIITNKCHGRLTLTGTRFGLQPKLTEHVIGLSDWVQRGTIVEEAAPVIKTVLASISSFSGAGGLTVAGVRYQDADNARIFFAKAADGSQFILEVGPVTSLIPTKSKLQAVLYELTPEVLVYRHYTYAFHTAAAILEGQDDSAAQASLRFTASNVIKVYVNGVELPSSAYDRSVDNKITLTPQIIDTNIIIDVFVYNDIRTAFDPSNAIVLEFKALRTDKAEDLSLRNACGWGNVAAIKDKDDNALLFFCTNIEELDNTKSYGVAYFNAVAANDTVMKIDPAELTILISSQPHAFNDKQLTRYLTGSSLLNNGVLSFKQSEATGIYELSVIEDLITKVFVPIEITSKLTDAELTNPLAQEVTPQSQSTATPVAYILGPC